ncbi:MAG TPA: hypothetical protein VN947_36505 [Polyangia bacterium]|nr:hypothetical protein [Polyangia bacterium]
MTRLVRLTAVVALLAPLCLVAGCKQGVGDRCQVQTDCDDGLLCVLNAGATPQAGGTCQMPNTTGADMASPVSTDMAGIGPDMVPPSDMTPPLAD